MIQSKSIYTSAEEDMAIRLSRSLEGKALEILKNRLVFLEPVALSGYNGQIFLLSKEAKEQNKNRFHVFGSLEYEEKAYFVGQKVNGND